MPEETTKPTPTTIVAVQCSHCKKLIPETDEYLHVLNLKMNQIIKKGQERFRGHRKFQLGLENAVFCDVECFCHHVRNEECEQTSR